MTVNDKIIDWIEKRVKNEYSDDIALILLYGSYVNKTANAKSDVDCYFIPRTEKGYQFAADFIIQDIGYDIFPMNWERVEGIANLKETLLPCVGDVKILYYHSPEELDRFKKIQKQLRDNLYDRAYTGKIAKEKFECACKLYFQLENNSQMMKVRLLAGNMIMTLADAAAVYNQDYFHFGLKKQYEDLHRFENIPPNFIREYDNVIKSEEMEEIKEHCKNLIKEFSDFTGWEFAENAQNRAEKITAAEENKNTDFYFLARLYEEISSTFNKIYICAETGNYILAYLSAVCLQGELQEISQEQGIVCYDILSLYNYKDLEKLAVTTRKVEKNLVQMITDGGEKINRFLSFEEFEKANL